jgi:surface protein
MYGAFQGCANLTINASDAPDLTAVSDLSFMFSGATAFDSDIGGWDVNHVQSFSLMFYGATSFNQPLNSWDVSAATDMYGVFWHATSFNQPLNSWDVSAVRGMGEMFSEASSFNQDISGWDTTSATNMKDMFSQASSFNQDISGWDISNVASIEGMFYQAGKFNQPIGAWDTSSVTNMRYIFYHADDFNQNISNWDVSNISNVTSMQAMFYSTSMSSTNYDLLLKGWSTQPLQSGIYLDMGDDYDINYCAAGPERASIISNYNWTIRDGGQECPSLLSYQKVFTEKNTNDGSIDNSRSSYGEDEYGNSLSSALNIMGGEIGVFSAKNFIEGADYTSTNVPAGLSLDISGAGISGYGVRVSLNGNATSHAAGIDDASDITITFLDSAFDYVPANLIQNNPQVGFSIEFTDEEETSAPTNISLSNSSINENTPPPGDIGTLTTEDPDSADTFTYTLDCDSSAPDDSSFLIDTDQLKLNLSADYENKNSYNVCIRSTDQTGKSYQKNFTIDINDLDESQPIPQTDFSLSISLLQTGEIKAGDTVTYKYTVKNEGPNDAELIGGLYIITPPEFTVGTIDKPVQSPDPIGPMPVSSVGLSVISSSYPGYNFVIFESESDPSHTVFTSGVSETFTITGNANTDFTNNQTTTRAIYGNADYEDTEAIALNTAIQSNQDFFLLPGNNVAHHTYTHGLSNPPTNPTNPFVNFTPKPASTGHPLASTGGIVASLSFISGTLLMIGALFTYAKRGIQ